MKGNLREGKMTLYLVRAGVRWMFVVDVATSVVLSETALGPVQQQTPRTVEITEDDQKLMPFFLPNRPCPFPGLEALHTAYFADLAELQRSHDGSCPPCKEGELMREYKARILRHPAFPRETRPVILEHASGLDAQSRPGAAFGAAAGRL